MWIYIFSLKVYLKYYTKIQILQPVGVYMVFVTVGPTQLEHVNHNPVNKASLESCVMNMNFPVGRAKNATSTPPASWNEKGSNSECPAFTMKKKNLPV